MKIKLIPYGTALYPMRAHDNDAGADVYAQEQYLLQPNDICSIPLGFGVEIPDGYVGYVFPRSSLSARGIVCQLPPIDSGYRGEIHAVVANISKQPYIINSGDRIGQLVVMPVVIADYVHTLNERGTGAFGSTGK